MLGLCLIPFAPIERTSSLKTSIYINIHQFTINRKNGLSSCFVAIQYSRISFIIISYIYIIKCLHQSSRRVNENAKNSTKLSAKITKLTFKIIFVYCLTWAPSIIYYMLVTAHPSIFSKEYYTSELEDNVTFIIKYITFSDTVAAPIMYCYYHDGFCKEAKKLYNSNNEITSKKQCNSPIKCSI